MKLLASVDISLGFGECLGGFERPDRLIEEREDVARIGIQHVVVAHHVDDGVGAEPLGAEFQEVLDELAFGTATVGVGLAVAVQEVLGEIQHAVLGGRIEAGEAIAGKQQVQRRSGESAFGKTRLQLGGQLAVVFDVDLVRDGHSYLVVALRA